MRVHPMRLLRSVLIFIAVLFALLNLHVLLNLQTGGSVLDHFQRNGMQDNHQRSENGHVQFEIPDHLDGLRSRDAEMLPKETGLVIPPNKNISHRENRTHFPVDMKNITMIGQTIKRINAEQRILNLHKFGLKLNSESVVIVIQAHDRAEYLQILMDSLRRVRDIEKALVIVSHDVYSETLNSIVQSVDFCPIMQIFFPHSIQAHPNQFPGDDPNDCPRDIKRDQALKIKCNNAEHPDKYGHYREAKYSQTKHHWWWKLNRVFDGLTVMRNYEGLVLLLEEDYYLSEDAITVLHMLHHLRDRDCKDCQIITLGNYDKTQNYPFNSGKVETAHWISSKHNLGMTFTRHLWNKMRSCFKEYCLFDDYNWDWTVQHLSTKCLPQKLKVMKMKATRVFHMGECGLHQKKKDCQPQDKKKQVQAILSDKKQYLFPNVLVKSGFSPLKLRDPKPNGGWGDLRDRELCLSFTKGNSTAPAS